MTTMIRILRDFKPLLNLDLNGEHMPEERIAGSQTDLDLSAGCTYTVHHFHETKCIYDLEKEDA